MRIASLALSAVLLPSTAVAQIKPDTTDVFAPTTLSLMALGLAAWVGSYAWKRRKKGR